MDSLNVWGNSLLSAMTTLWSKIAGFVPNLLAFLLILLIGAPLLAYFSRRTGAATPITGTPKGDRQADLHPTFCGIGMLVLSASFAGIKVALCASC